MVSFAPSLELSFFALYPNPIFFLPPPGHSCVQFMWEVGTLAQTRRINAQNTFIPNRLRGKKGLHNNAAGNQQGALLPP